MAKAATNKRTELNQAFIADLLIDWEANGAEVIERLRREHPAVYAQLVAKLVPQRVEVAGGESVFDGMESDDIQEYLVREFASDPATWGTFKARVEMLIASGDPIVRIVIDAPAPGSAVPRGKRPSPPRIGK